MNDGEQMKLKKYARVAEIVDDAPTRETENFSEIGYEKS
jgi:hypothetical protein